MKWLSSKKLLLFIVIFIIGLMLLVWWRYRAETMADKTNGNLEPSRVEMDENKTIVVASAKIDAYGGVIKAGNSGSPIDGMIIEIPAGAVEKEDTFSLGYNEGKIIVNDGSPSSDVIYVFSAEKTKGFDQPVKIKVPYNPSIPFRGNLGIHPCAVDEKGRISGLQLRDIDKENHTLWIDTFVPCSFIYIYDNSPLFGK